MSFASENGGSVHKVTEYKHPPQARKEKRMDFSLESSKETSPIDILI
jgi:hypothetical protein